MADVVLVAVLIAFFGLAVAFVRACDRILGADVEELGSETADREAERAA